MAAELRWQASEARALAATFTHANTLPDLQSFTAALEQAACAPGSGSSAFGRPNAFDRAVRLRRDARSRVA